MGVYYSTMIGIRAGGVFSGDVDMENLTKRVSKVAKEMAECDYFVDFNIDDPTHCMSKELSAHKGSYVVLAGVFNYWGKDDASELAKRLSKEFGTDVMVMTWAEEAKEPDLYCNVFTNGVPLSELNENPILQTVRRAQ